MTPRALSGATILQIVPALRGDAAGHAAMDTAVLLLQGGARTIIARETAKALAEHDPPVLASAIGQRVGFADAAQSGRLISELDGQRAGTREIAALCGEVGRLAP